MKSDHIKRMITLTGDNIKRLSLYIGKRQRWSGKIILDVIYERSMNENFYFSKCSKSYEGIL
jgi:hypothetical protein